MGIPKDPLEIILNGEQITETINTRRGKFVIAFPLPSDLRKIEIEVARMLNGNAASSFSSDTLSNFRAYATLDVVIKEAPKWWNDLESAENCPDDNLIMELYRRYLQFYRKVQKALSRGRFGSDVGKIKSRTEDEALADKPFSGIANG